MFGLLLTTVGTFFLEIGSSIGKYEVSHRREDIYTMAFLNHFGGFLLFILLVLWQGDFRFSIYSLPFWLLQMGSEALHIWLAGKATIKSDRSTWGFLRMGTVPILLICDALLGYDIQPLQYVGILFIIMTLFLLYKQHGFTRKGVGWVIAATINAALAITLYKHAITYYNSVAAHQLVSGIFVMAFVTWLCKHHRHHHPLRLYKEKLFVTQSLSFAFGGILDSFAYTLAPASIIVTGKRCASALFTILAGNFYFHEERLAVKLFAFVILCIGMVFLAFQT
ncbi:MAG: hypothetical protein HY817_00030 [Candidatus Abawacabacteria bacterium]|nr:hypothetical protein [Candidatus Abawacabacteria bacterium]